MNIRRRKCGASNRCTPLAEKSYSGS